MHFNHDWFSEPDNGAGCFALEFHNGITYSSHISTYWRWGGMHFSHDLFPGSDDGVGSCSTICLATEFTEFTLSRPTRRAGRGSGGGGCQSRVGSFELFLFVPRSCFTSRVLDRAGAGAAAGGEGGGSV
ncbi:hypothetical protein EVAR_52567_1 [Eumeta japonica]|uniref:Uncharacterized protein n=1 Tax=Eumeta variegata TaxID=151549 RepID=A0A4C1YDM8_EUMVA|nr:hypothetical protein EVAR_52567_1 [Eumeta japonica]